MSSPPEFGRVPVTLGHEDFDAATVEAAYFLRRGEGVPVVYLHGLGSSFRDVLNAADPRGLPGRTLLGIDFPGCGRSPYPADVTLGMDDLVRFVIAVVDRLLEGPIILVGHSMGGLVALLATVRVPDRVHALVSVEGNLAPEDCFLSRKGATWGADGFGERLRAELRSSGDAGFLCYAERFHDEVSDDVFRAYSRSIVHHSDRGPLLDWLTAMTMPRLFVYGEENGGLGYLDRLADAGVALAAVPESNHFPLYSNPAAFFAILRGFLDGLDQRAGEDPRQR